MVKFPIFLPLLLLITFSCDAVKVDLISGPIRGKLEKINGQQVQVFKGVPYAAKPIGALRFQNAQPAEPWNETILTTEYSPACMSNTSQTTSPQSYISEDCLYINIWADLRCRNNPCPVVFYLHGGGFHFDSATMFNDTEIMSKFASERLVFVVPAFRLGLFAVLDLGEELQDAPYNVGLNDIIFALRWVQTEISKFGGDPKKVTVFGNSGGASVVSELLVSPAVSTDLFSRAWVASGLPILEPHLNLNTSDVIATQAGVSFLNRNLRVWPGFGGLYRTSRS
uniref:Carboxylic ester hydrolase n=1 Tax=Bursaphelenchus xylophilus TaxID=6326 RepID=A0A1I7RJC0_BURXY